MNESDTRRMPIRTIKVAAIPQHTTLDQCYFPINAQLVRNLEEQMAIRIEMLNLTKKAEEAAKYVFQEMLWQWFYEAQDNSVTSYRGCIAPIVMNTTSPLVGGDDDQPSNRWGWKSEEEYLESHKGEGIAKTAPTNQ